MTLPAGSSLSFVVTVAFWAAFSGIPACTACGDELFTPGWHVGLPGEQDRPESLRAIAVSPDGRRIALAGEPETATTSHAVQLRDAGTGAIEHLLTNHESAVRSLSFSAGGERLATITQRDNAGTVRVFDVESGALLRSIDGGGFLIRFLPDDRLLVGGFSALRILDATTGDEIERHPLMPIVKDVSRDGRRAVGVSHHGSNRLEVRAVEQETPLAQLDGCQTEPLAAIFSPDGRMVAAADPRGRCVLVWEVLTGGRVHRFETAAVVSSLAFSPDGRLLLAGGVDRSLHVWNIATGSDATTESAHDGAVMALAVGPNDALFTGGTDHTVRRWSVAGFEAATAAEPPTDAELDAAWDALAGQDAGPAYRALGLISRVAGPALEAMHARVERQLRPVPDDDLARLLTELNDADYRVRERSTFELMRAAGTRRPELEQALATATSPEVRARLRVILRRSDASPRFTAGDVLRLKRLIGLAAACPGEASHRLLRLIADEFPDAALAAEARGLLEQIED